MACRHMRWFLAVLGLGLLPPAHALALNVTLGDAIQRSLASQPAMIEAQGTRSSARASDRAAWGAFLPTLTTSGSATRTNPSLVAPPQFVYSGGLSANLELFDGFRRLAEKRASTADIEAAEAGLTNQRFQVTLSTKQLFYDAAARDDLTRVAESQLRRAEQQLQVAVQKMRAGSATRSDTLRATVDVGTARIALLQAQADLATAEANLGRQIGVDQPVGALPDSVIPPLPDTSRVRAEAMESGPQLLQSEAQSRSARAQVSVARAQYWPDLSVGYSDSRQGLGSPLSHFGDYDESGRWSFGVSWTLFNGFQRESDQVQARVQRDLAAARAADTRRALNAQLTQQLSALMTAYAQLDIAAANVAAAEEDFRVQNERYRLGAATIVDLSTSQANLTQAQVSLVQARFSYLIARAQVAALVGREL